MNKYRIIAKDIVYIVNANEYKFIREKGGFCRYEFYKINETVSNRIRETVATFAANYVDAIKKENEND